MICSQLFHYWAYLIKPLSYFLKLLINSSLIAPSLIAILACGTSSNSLEDSSNKAPIISIKSPLNNQSKSQNTEVVFIGSAEDAEDGDLSHQINWQSNIDGYLGTGAEITTLLREGNHIITAIAVDSNKVSSQDNINLVLIQAYGVAVLSWQPPTQNTDNSELTDLAGFNIYYGQSSSNLNNIIRLSSATAQSYVFEDLELDATYYFSVTAYNSLGFESEKSDLASKLIQQ